MYPACTLTLLIFSIPSNYPILLSAHTTPKCPLPFRLLDQTVLCTYELAHTCHIPHPSHIPLLSLPTNVWRRVEFKRPNYSVFLYAACAFLALERNIFPSTMFLNTLEINFNIPTGTINVVLPMRNSYVSKSIQDMLRSLLGFLSRGL
jgi:hypothetical protein